jgi:hypothetical protein
MKWGFASATFAAMILSDRIAGRQSRWADTFAPTRLSLRSLHELAGLGAKQSAGTRLPVPEWCTFGRPKRERYSVPLDRHLF